MNRKTAITAWFSSFHFRKMKSTEWKEGVDYIKFGKPNHKSDRKVYSARCLHCGAEFSNHRSIRNHKEVCQGKKAEEQQNTLEKFVKKTQNDEEEVEINDFYKLLIRAFVSLDLPLSAIENQEFREFMSFCAPDYEIISKKELRKLIISYSNQIKKENIEKLTGKNVSLVVDGTTSWNNKLYETVIFHPSSLFHYGLIEFSEATGKNIAEKLTEVVQDLNQNEISIAGTTTDNASNLKAAFAEAHSFSVGKNLNIPCIRFACMAHTAQLLIDDLYKNSELFHKIYEDVKILIQWCRKMKKQIRELEFMEKLPKLSNTRWNAIVDALFFFNTNNEFFIQLLNDSDEPEKPEINFDCWPEALEALTPIMIFTNKIQGNYVTISLAFQYLLELENSLKELRGNQFVNVIESHLRRRFTETCDSDTCELAFLLTKEGHSWWQERKRTIPSDSKRSLTEEETFNLISYFTEYEGMKKVLRRTAEGYSVNSKKAVQAFELYLQNDIDDYNDILKFWSNQRGKVVNGVTFFDLSVVAANLSVVPATEAVVERVFSFLKRIHTCARSTSKVDILDAILNIKTSIIWLKE